MCKHRYGDRHTDWLEINYEASESIHFLEDAQATIVMWISDVTLAMH